MLGDWLLLTLPISAVVAHDVRRMGMRTGGQEDVVVPGGDKSFVCLSEFAESCSELLDTH